MSVSLRRQWVQRNTALPILLIFGWLMISAGAPLNAPESRQAQSVSYAPGEVIIGLADGTLAADITLPKNTKWGATGSGLKRLNAAKVNVPAGQEEAYRERLLLSEGVLFADLNYRVQAAAIPDDPFYSLQYGPLAIGAQTAWDATTGSSGVIIAVLDSGIDAAHPEFAGRLLPGYDFVQNDSTPQDLCGHGTHVSGIIAANANNQQGVAGVDWQSRLMPVRVLDGGCSGSLEDVAEGLVWAVDRGARVINLSLGVFGSPSSRLLEYATYYAYQHGAALFAAAGNSGGSGIYYPAAYPWVMAVGFTNALNQRDSRSTSGAQLDLMAPGDQIYSTTPSSGSFYYQRIDGTSSTYGYLSGTSMATAFASGAAGLLASQPQFNTPDKIYTALTSSAQDLGDPGFDNLTGYGLLRVDLALNATPGGDTPASSAPTVEYDMLSSARCENIQYAWQSIPRSLSAYPNGNLAVFPGDNNSDTVTLPFTFNYGGAAYNEVTISSNGYLAFDGIGEGSVFQPNQADNFIIPVSNSSSPYGPTQPFGSDEFLAPFWDDLVPATTLDDTRKVYAATLEAIGGLPRRFVVEWYRVPLKYASNSSVTLQAVLLEGSDEIIYQYQTLSGTNSTGGSATVGLEYNAGQTGLLYAYNQAGALRNNQAIHFYPQTAGAERTTPGCQLTTSLGSAGGSIDFAPFCLEFGSGVLADDTTLQLTTFSSFAPAKLFPHVSLGHFAEITLDPVPRPPLSPQPTVCYHYTARDVLKAGGSPDNLFLALYDTHSNLWEPLITSVDRGQTRLTAPVPHFSVVGVFTNPQPDEPPETGAARHVPTPLSGWASFALLIGTVVWAARRA